ncbi:hypothetical protein E24_00358 [Faustovirus]|nr:hypothetical protein PRJ_Fausto_00336 [Faustovirus]AMN83274.1 hypothetical protein E24_00358 [Faustovirus]AMN84257.1 hypothetical protein D5a_00355 [Faustovirus]AMN85245.1 hypothetical protein E23_00358 [Faustovirus]QBR99243.1 hypothetical protein [Faustovirus mariensis]
MEGFMFAVRGVSKFSKNCAKGAANVTADAIELIHNLNPIISPITTGFGRGIVLTLSYAYRKNKLNDLNLQKIGKFSYWIWIALLTHDIIEVLAQPIYHGLRSLANSFNAPISDNRGNKIQYQSLN